MSEEDNKDSEDKSLGDLAKEEITKATISQSIGTLLFPITRELAQLEEAGIKKLKSAIRNRRKSKLGEKNRKAVEEIVHAAEVDPELYISVEKLHDVFEKAAESDLEQGELFALWSSIIQKLRVSNFETDILVDKLESMTPTEAAFLLNFEHHERSPIYVNGFLRAIKASSYRDPDLLRDEQTAISLSEKGILEQPFSIQRALILVLTPIIALLVGIEVMRPILEKSGVNPSSANNVILIAVVGVIFGLASITTLRHKLKLTWVGKKLYEGALPIFEHDLSHNKSSNSDAASSAGS
jgi:hypothetical protein